MNYVYILECSDRSLYTGWTNDLVKRLKAHGEGKGGKYTRAKLPVKLVYFEEYEDKIEAQKREYEIKQKKRDWKLQLIERGSALEKFK
ncbi:Excinuclease ABC C subunit domain protein [Alkaliphilus oremlandii OhILAs]|uniref:Excinuclease ABC C subunit domain protein n=2 Tax=Alkaliphilus oremlandii TaxID=461876 RepID=A8ML29_ALKOO|nr:Excinuclease ABC C subunit domain protein [Alkaliphilus oremlandii OhILAs]